MPKRYEKVTESMGSYKIDKDNDLKTAEIRSALGLPEGKEAPERSVACIMPSEDDFASGKAIDAAAKRLDDELSQIKDGETYKELPVYNWLLKGETAMDFFASAIMDAIRARARLAILGDMRAEVKKALGLGGGTRKSKKAFGEDF